MTPQQFREQTDNTEAAFAQYLPELECLRCRRKGHLIKRLDERGRWVVVCAACDSSSPDLAYWVLRKPDTPVRRKLTTEDKREVWDRFQRSCVICGLTFEELKQFGAYPDVHHGRMFTEHGDGDPKFLISVCTICHEAANWIQRTTRRVLGKEDAV